MTLRKLAIATSLVLTSFSALSQASSPSIDQARAVLREAMDSGDFTTRVQGIQAAGLIGPNEILRLRLEKFLEDGKVEVRIAAIRTLADLKSTASIPVLQKHMKQDNTPEVRFAAGKALYALHDPSAQEWLLGVYHGTEKTNSDAVHSEARKFFGNFHSFESATMFIVTSGIGYVPVPGVGEGFSAVTGLLSDPDLSPRAAALLMLTREKTPQADLLLRDGLKDSDWSVRASAAQMIAYTARTDLSQNLVPLFSDKTPKVRLRAAGAYLHLAILARSPDAPAKL